MRDDAKACEAHPDRTRRVSTVIVQRGDAQTSACGVGPVVAMALMRAELEHRSPKKGGDEMTLVQPEGVPTPNRAVVSRDTGEVVGRASGAQMTGPTAQAGCGQTPQGESNRCQGQLIVTPAAGNTAGGAHDAPSAVCKATGDPCVFERIDPRDEKQLGMRGLHCVECGRAKP